MTSAGPPIRNVVYGAIGSAARNRAGSRRADSASIRVGIGCKKHRLTGICQRRAQAPASCPHDRPHPTYMPVDFARRRVAALALTLCTALFTALFTAAPAVGAQRGDLEK